MIDLKKLVKEMIWDCTIDDITASIWSNVIFFNANIVKEYFNNYLPTHYTLNNKLVYITDTKRILFSFDEKKVRIGSGYKTIVELDLTQSLSRLKLQQLRDIKNFNNSILKLCHTGK